MTKYTKAIIFDIGNVLIHFDGERMLRQISQVLGISESQVIDLYVHQELGSHYEKGLVTSEEFYQRFSQLAHQSHVDTAFWKAFCDIFKPNPEMETLIRELKERGQRLILLSNTCEAHFDYIHKQFELLALFDRAILSYQVGARKPERAIFEAAVKAAGVPPEQCFYTDDITAYVSAARELEIPAVTFTSATSIRLHLEQIKVL